MLEQLVRKFLYYPLVLDKSEPLPSYARDAKEVWIAAEDNNEIHGLYWKAEKKRPTLLYLHGNAQSVYEWALVKEELMELDCGLLLIDYPGYGKSSGKPCEQSLYACGRAALNWLTNKEGIPKKDIVVLGKSLGGGVTCEIMQGESVKGVILESTFRSIPSVAPKLIPQYIEGKIFKSEKYDSINKINTIKSPILIIHGTQDELIPFSEAEELYRKAEEPKSFYRVEGAHHNDVAMIADKEYGRTIKKWLDSL